MHVLHIEPPSPALQGDQIYRTRQPCDALAEVLPQGSVISGPYLTADVQRLVLRADVLVLCQTVDVDLWPLWRARAAAGRANIFEINDNFLALQAFNEAAQFYANPLIRSLTQQFAASAHGLQFSSYGLQKMFGHLSSAPQRVWMNQLAEAPPPLPGPRPDDGRLTIGWGGSLGHRDDVAAIVPAIATLLTRNPQVHWAAMTARSLHPLFAELPAARCRLHGLGDLPAYRRFLAGLDVGLAPLLETPFNCGRSDVKFLEYAAAGAVPVVQDCEVYRASVRHGDNGLRFASCSELLAGLQGLIDAREARLAMRQRAWDSVRHGRLESDHAAARRDYYAACMQRAAAGRTVPPADYRLDELRPTQRRRGRHVTVLLDAAEQTLYGGMLERQRPQVAIKQLRLAAKRAPTAYLPQLLCGQTEADPSRAMAACRRALALQPASLNAAYTLSTQLVRAQRLDEATAAARVALGIADDFAPAHEALASLAQARGDAAALKAHLEAAVAANPFYLVPVARLAVLHQQAGAWGDALRCLQAGLRWGPDDWLLQHLLAQTLLAQKQPGAALRHARRALELSADPRPVQANLAKIYLALGDLRGARSALKAAQPSASSQ